jgi:hypothetical protein
MQKERRIEEKCLSTSFTCDCERETFGVSGRSCAPYRAPVASQLLYKCLFVKPQISPETKLFERRIKGFEKTLY